MNRCKCLAVLYHPSLQQHIRKAAEKPFACTRLEQRGHGSQERNVVRATSERAQQSSPVLRPTPVHPAAPPSAIAAFSSRAEIGPKQSLPYH